jgi:hypothetical protein
LEAALDHRSYRDRGVALQPTKHLGPRETLSLRAGRPGTKARRNERIRRLNARLAELERQRRLNAERQASAMRAEDAQLFVLREDLRRARRRLRDALAGSPMAGDHDALRTSSALFVEGVPVADTAFPDGRRALDQVRTRLRAVLGDGWLDVRVRDRLFMLRPGHEEVIVVGLGWLATDSVEPGTGRLVVDLVHELGLKDLRGFAAENQQELRDGVDAALRERGESCAWSERRASLHSSASPR